MTGIRTHSAGQFSPRLRDLRGERFPTFNAYWNDDKARQRIDAEIQHNRDLVNAAIDAGMAGMNEKQAQRWIEGEI